MPREWNDIIRKSNTETPLRVFVLAYEGNVAEPKYFDALKNSEKFNDEIIHLEELKRTRKDGRSDPKHVFAKLKFFYNQQRKNYNFKKDDEFWMVIDRDSWNCLPEIIKLCKVENNFFCAISNPCFEIWLLMHIFDIELFSAEEKKKIHENKKVSSCKHYIDIVLGESISGGYNKVHPKPNRFIPHIDIAIERAKKIDKSNNDYPSEIGSHVYKLVKKIIK